MSDYIAIPRDNGTIFMQRTDGENAMDSPLSINEELIIELYYKWQRSKTIIENMVEGVEAWAADGEGIPPSVFDAYQKAKIALGQIRSIKNEE